MRTTAITIAIPNPCQQNWEEMENRGNNKFCLSCQKTVIDFTGYTHQDIIETVMTHKGSRQCGRLTNHQLHQLSYALVPVPPTHHWLKHLGVLAIGTLFLMQGCTKTLPDAPVRNQIYGYVVNESKQPLSGVSITIPGTTFTTVTDVNGRYEISRAVNKHDKLLAEREEFQGTFLGIDPSKNLQDTVILTEIVYAIAGKIDIRFLPPAHQK